MHNTPQDMMIAHIFQWKHGMSGTKHIDIDAGGVEAATFVVLKVNYHLKYHS